MQKVFGYKICNFVYIEGGLKINFFDTNFCKAFFKKWKREKLMTIQKKSFVQCLAFLRKGNLRMC